MHAIVCEDASQPTHAPVHCAIRSKKELKEEGKILRARGNYVMWRERERFLSSTGFFIVRPITKKKKGVIGFSRATAFGFKFRASTFIEFLIVNVKITDSTTRTIYHWNVF